MGRFGCLLIAFGLLGPAAKLRAKAAADGGLIERVARWCNRDLRQTDARLASLDSEVRSLPTLLPQPFASRYGFRSGTLLAQDDPQWLQIDLARSWLIDRIVLMPVKIPTLGERGSGYGFPLRFRIEVADNAEMQGAVVVLDRTGEDVANPGAYPLVFQIAATQARHVRVTSTKHFPVEVGFIWALEELMILSGNQLVATDLEPHASSSLELFPNWSVHRVNDGQSALGMPTSNDPSPSRGYLSGTTNDPNEEMWLTVDLGREQVIDEVRLLPVEPEGFEMLGEQSQPRSWTVDLATDPEFNQVVWQYHRPRTNLAGYPGRCAVLLTCPAPRGRFLRLRALDLWGTADQCGFGLAEIQAYSHGRNVALGMPVRVNSMADPEAGSGWSPEFAVDGFSSRRRLIEWPEYLDLITQRGALEAEREQLLESRKQTLRTTTLVLGYSGGTLGGVALIGWAWLLIRQRTDRQLAVKQLREQIARDLHDDIGSNLGGIVLLSEMGSRFSADQTAREDFAAIKEAAEETSKSMQDMVWLIGDGKMGLRDLVIRMRLAASHLLGDAEVSLTVVPAEFGERQLSLFFRRHAFFSYKEALNNIRRHANATEVIIHLMITSRHLSFEIRDNGNGFDPASATRSGHGLANLQRRASRLKGSCTIDSSPGTGTRITFNAPFKS